MKLALMLLLAVRTYSKGNLMDTSMLGYEFFITQAIVIFLGVVVCIKLQLIIDELARINSTLRGDAKGKH